MQLNEMTKRLERYGIKQTVEVMADSLDISAMKANRPGMILWRRHYASDDMNAIAWMAKLLEELKLLREFQKKQTRAEAALDFISVEYREPALEINGWVEVQCEKAPNQAVLGVGNTAKITYETSTEFTVMFDLTKGDLLAYERWIDHCEARNLLVSRERYLSENYGVEVQIHDNWFELHFTSQMPSVKSMKHDLTMAAVKTFLDEVEKSNIKE